MTVNIKIDKGTAEENEFINDKIVEYNASQVPFSQTEHFVSLCYSLKNIDNVVIGGITSFLYCWKCLYIDVLWVDEKYRHSGYGSKLLEKVESEAVKQGCHLVHLDTFDFQAKDFYIKKGYEVFGELNDCPPGHRRYYLHKKLIDKKY